MDEHPIIETENYKYSFDVKGIYSKNPDDRIIKTVLLYKQSDFLAGGEGYRDSFLNFGYLNDIIRLMGIPPLAKYLIDCSDNQLEQIASMPVPLIATEQHSGVSVESNVLLPLHELRELKQLEQKLESARFDYRK